MLDELLPTWLAPTAPHGGANAADAEAVAAKERPRRARAERRDVRSIVWEKKRKENDKGEETESN